MMMISFQLCIKALELEWGSPLLVMVLGGKGFEPLSLSVGIDFKGVNDLY